jgi:hypothetical protein
MSRLNTARRAQVVSALVEGNSIHGGRDAGWARSSMEDVASRLSTRVQITTDGHRAYVEAVAGAFGMDVDHAMLIKLNGSPAAPETRYSTACASARKL